MAKISVTRREGGFAVTVDRRRFTVTASQKDVDELGGGKAERLVRESFEFLLEREPVTSVLPSFDLSVIERYFPEWRAEMQRRIRRD